MDSQHIALAQSAKERSLRDFEKTGAGLPNLSPQVREHVDRALREARAEAYQQGYRDASRKLLTIASVADTRVERILNGAALATPAY